MTRIQGLCLIISRISLALLAIIMVVVVILRSFFDLGWVWLQESATYFHATAFLLMIAYALRSGDHVKVDLFYQRFSSLTKKRIQVLGNLIFVLPVSVFIFYKSYPYVMQSWQISEGSLSVGGLPFLYILKTLLLIFPLLLGVEALCNTASLIKGEAKK